MRSLKLWPFLCLGILAAGSLAVSSVRTSAAGISAAATPTPTPASTPDDDNSTIRIDTELVNLDVRVVDRNNRPVNNLTQKDFSILEDGVKQSIEFFSKSEVPTNYSIVIDASKSLKDQFEKVIEAGKIMVESNKPADETSLIKFVGRDKISIEVPFTTERGELNEGLDSLFLDGGQTAIRDAVYLAVENVQSYKPPKGGDRLRRAIVLVTDGEDRDSYYDEKSLFELLRESDVQIYVIGFVDDLSKDGGFISKSPQAKAKSFLERMATETGGKAYFPSNIEELPNVARDISSELRTQYSIGYIPSNEARDGSFRAIKVQVVDGPGASKRIAITRSGRNAEGTTGTQMLSVKPTPTPSPTPKKNQ